MELDAKAKSEIAFLNEEMDAITTLMACSGNRKSSDLGFEIEVGHRPLTQFSDGCRHDTVHRA